MAKNREPEKPVESQSDSGEEEESGEELEEASSEEANSQESDSEPELEEQQKKVTTPAPQKQIKVSNKATPIKQTQSSSSSEEESGSESDSDSDRPEVASPQPKSTSGPKKPRSGVQATTTSTLAKRPAEDKESGGRDAKKAKKKPDSPVKSSKDDPKKSLFQRLWSEDDEIAILKGMIEYSSKKKSDPVADVSAFLDFIKEDLHVDVSRTQLQDKIRRLKKKYENNKSKEKDGKSRTFAKSHEQKAYELSKLVWGKDNGGGENGVGSPKANGNGSAAKRALLIKKAAAGAGENEEDKESGGVVVSGKNERKGLSSIGVSSVEERIMRAGEELFGGEGEGVKGEDEWRKLKVEEIELYVKQVEVKLAQSRLVLGALKSANC